MGLTISRFSECYKALTDGKYKSVFGKVKMTCIVCNHSWNVRVSDIICRNEELYERTGADMLYIAFDGRVRNRWGGYGYGEDEANIRKCMREEGAFDNDEMVDIIREYIDFNGDIPFIIISADVNSKDVLVMPTSARLIERQLVELGRYCTESSDVSLGDKRIAEIGDVFPYSLPLPFVEVLANITVLNEVANSKDSFLNNIVSEEYAVSALDKLRSIASTVKESLVSKYERLMDLAKANRERCGARRGFGGLRRGVPDYFCHSYDNYGIREFGQYINDLGGNVLISFNNYQNDLDSVDLLYERNSMPDRIKSFARPVSSLYQLTQETLNYTASQYIRQCLGIPMPEYFFKWYEESLPVDYVETGGEEVYFNSRDYYYNWRGPELGRLSCALRVIREDGLFEDEMSLYPVMIDRQMQGLLPYINRPRNASSHNGAVVSEKDFVKAYKAFMRFVEFVPELLEMKESMVRRERPPVGSKGDEGD